MPRTIDPSRRTLPLEAWPAIDRRDWKEAIAAGDILDGRGPAAHWADRTKATNMQHYGRWLGYLAWQGRLDRNRAPADRVTPDQIRPYMDHLQTIVAPRTVLSMLVGLKVTIQAMTPDRSWLWLQDLCNRVQRNSAPATDKRSRLRPSQEIYATALQELDRLSREEPGLQTAVDCRDALMLALLAARPIRVKNMTTIAMDQHLMQVGDRWLLVFTTAETKNKQHLEYFLPDTLTPHLECYLTAYRPVFPDADTSPRLWLNRYGASVGDRFVYLRIVKLTQRLLGAPINPHLLRDCAASSLAAASSDMARSAAPLLGHRHFATTERYYVQANNLEASRRLNGILSRIKHAPEDQT